MDAPKPKDTIIIVEEKESVRLIGFYAHPQYKTTISNFGYLTESKVTRHKYDLTVSPLYDFNEVLNWMKSHKK